MPDDADVLTEEAVHLVERAGAAPHLRGDREAAALVRLLQSALAEGFAGGPGPVPA